MTSLFRDINYGSGNILFIEENLLQNTPIVHQIEVLREDLLQVSYRDEAYILDVGWYPSFTIDGEFQIMVVQQHDWVNPLCKWHTSDIHVLQSHIQTAVNLIGQQI